MKKTTWHFRHWWWAVVLPILALIWPYLQVGVPYTHDGENHLARFANYKIAVREGQIPPRFAPNLMNHYGYPVFNYNYPLANILSLPFNVLDINYELTFKVLVTAGLLLGSWGVWRWLSLFKFEKFAKWLAVGAYLVAPFTANLIYVRGNIGELMALGLFPWLLYLSKKISQKKKISWWCAVPIISAFLLSHNVAALFGVGLWLLYSWYELVKNKQLWQQWGKYFGLSLLITSWFWLPALAEKPLVVLDNTPLSRDFAQHFVSSSQLISSPLEFGYSLLSQVDTMSLSAGLLGLAGLFLATIWYLKIGKQARKAERWWWFILIGWLLLIFQTSISFEIWKRIPLGSFIQFPWRLSLFFVVLSLPLVSLTAMLARGLRWLLLLLFAYQLLAIWQLQPADRLHKEIIDYDLFSQSTSTLHENLPKTFTYQNIADWSPNPSVFAGEAELSVHHWTGSERRYLVRATTPVIIVEPTMYFAGWQTTVNDELIEYSAIQETDGRIAYQLAPGEYQVESRFTQNTWPRMVGNTASLLAVAWWGWLLWQSWRLGSKD